MKIFFSKLKFVWSLNVVVYAYSTHHIYSKFILTKHSSSSSPIKSMFRVEKVDLDTLLNNIPQSQQTPTAHSVGEEQVLTKGLPHKVTHSSNHFWIASLKDTFLDCSYLWMNRIIIFRQNIFKGTLRISELSSNYNWCKCFQCETSKFWVKTKSS